MTGYSSSSYAPAPPVRRRRHPGRTLLIVLLVLVVALVAVDRVGKWVAEREVASKLQSSQHLSQRPGVTIEGFPFLTQVAGNHYRAIRLSANDVLVGQDASDQVRVASVRARLTGVSTTDNFSGVTAEHVTGTARVGYDEISRELGVPIGYASGGRVQATKSVSVLGQTITAQVSARVTVPGGDQLAFSDVRVGIANTSLAVPSALTSQLSGIFAKQLSLQGLPFGLLVQQLTPTRSGVSVTASADNVELH